MTILDFMIVTRIAMIVTGRVQGVERVAVVTIRVTAGDDPAFMIVTTEAIGTVEQ